MIIRKITPKEIPFLKEMLYEAIFVEDGQPKFDKSIIEDPSLSKYIDNFGSDIYDLCLVAEENGKLIGASWGRRFEEKNKGYGYVNSERPELSIAIKESYRSKGIGTKLIKGIIDLYKSLGVKSISLSVDKKNKAFDLYKRLGFTVVNETQKSVVMRMDFGPESND